MRTNYLILGLILAWLAAAGERVLAAESAAMDDAAAFGKQETAYSAALSADGKNMVFVGPSEGTSTVAVVVDLTTGAIKQIARSEGDPLSLTSCDWAAADRLVCSMYGLERVQSVLLPELRTVAINADGSKFLPLGEKNTLDQLAIRAFDGVVVDWLNGVDGEVLMSRTAIPEMSTGKLTARTQEGLGVVKIDTRTGKATQVERPANDANDYISDGLGNIRLMTTTIYNHDTGMQSGEEHHFYRAPNERNWRELGKYIEEGAGLGRGIRPLAVDSTINAAYVLQVLNGRWALYRITLDGTMKSEVAYESASVDVDDVVRVGPRRGASSASPSPTRSRASSISIPPTRPSRSCWRARCRSCH